MKKMETNDWIMLNNIIYKIYTTENFDDMRYEILDQLKMVLDFDSADFYMASREEGKLLCDPVTYNCEMVIARNKKFLGAITFYRIIGKENFLYDDIFVLDMLKDHLAYRLEQFYKSEETGMDKITVTEAVVKYDLTKREHMILKQLMSGKDHAQICEELVISSNTLKKHILNIYRKMGIKNRVQLFKMVKEFE